LWMVGRGKRVRVQSGSRFPGVLYVRQCSGRYTVGQAGATLNPVEDLDRVRELRQKQADWRLQGEGLKQQLAEAVEAALKQHHWRVVAEALGVGSKERVYQIRRGGRR